MGGADSVGGKKGGGPSNSNFSSGVAGAEGRHNSLRATLTRMTSVGRL